MKNTDRETAHGAGDDRLDDLFARARDAAPLPPAALMDRVMQDAIDAMPDPEARPEPVPPAIPARPRGGILSGLWRALGGWPAAGGLVAAMAAGLWIGISPPTVIDTQLALYFGDTSGLFALDGGYDLALDDG